MPKAEKFYTVIVDYQGTTLVEQFYAASLRDLRETWPAQTQAKITVKAPCKSDRDFVLLDGLKNVWCTTFTDDNGVFFLLNAVETVKA